LQHEKLFNTKRSFIYVSIPQTVGAVATHGRSIFISSDSLRVSIP